MRTDNSNLSPSESRKGGSTPSDGLRDPGLTKPLTPMPGMFASLPADVAGMVRDDANLSMARQSVGELLEKTKEERLQLERARPLWRRLFSPKLRRTHRQEINVVGRQLRVLTTLLSRIQAVHHRLLPSLRAALVQHLGSIDPAYRQGVRAARYHEHWLRYHSILSERLVGFQRDLKAAMEALQEDIRNDRLKISVHGEWQIGQAHAVAADLERTVADLQRASNIYEATVDETPFSEVRLPKIEAWNCIAPLFRAAEKNPVDALRDIAHLYHDFNDNKPSMLFTIKTQFHEATAMHSALAEDRLNSSWAELRRYSETYLIYQGEIPEIVDEIESRQHEAERARYLRHLKPSPFVSSL